MLTWIFEYVWSLPRGVSPRLEWRHARALSSRLYQQCHASHRLDQGICIFPSSLSHEAFPRGFTTGLSHVHTCWESILDFNVKVVQGKQVPLEWTDTSGGLLEWWHDPGVPPLWSSSPVEFLSCGVPFLWRAPPLEMQRERREFFPYETGKGSLISR